MLAHFPLDGNPNDTRGDLLLTRGPGDANPQSLQFNDGAPSVTGGSRHLFISDEPNQFVSVRRQDDEEFVSFDESLSVSFWFRPDSKGTLLSIQKDADSPIALLEYNPDTSTSNTGFGPITFSVGGETLDPRAVPPSIVPLEDGWYHIAFVINPFQDDHRAIALFLNGRRVLRSELPDSLKNKRDEILQLLDIRVGDNHQQSDMFRGGISDLRFESIVLTGVQVGQQLLPEGQVLPTHTITFNRNGAEGDPPLTIRFVEGSDILIPGTGQMEGESFSALSHWSTDPQGNGANFATCEDVPLYKSLTLYAQWSEPIAVGGDDTRVITENGKRYRVHKFTSVGDSDFVVELGNIDQNANCEDRGRDQLLDGVEVLIVAGGGAGGRSKKGTYENGGGGGAGGMIERILPKSLGSHSITVGPGGISDEYPSTNGGNSVAFGFTAVGGGRGGGHSTTNNGADGGSGGGGTNYNGLTGGKGESHQGNDGGGAGVKTNTNGGSGGGGGAGGEGSGGNESKGGDGGVGRASSITGQEVFYAGGGGGSGGTPGEGGTGGGGAGGGLDQNGENGEPNTGGGGGGAWADGDNTYRGGDGGSGIVVIRYPIGLAQPQP